MPANPLLVIFAGGTSSRMWPLQEKLLLRFGDEPLLVNRLRRYQTLGFDEAVIIASAENEATIRDYTAHIDGMRVHVVVQTEPKGQGDALLQIEPVLEGRRNTPIYAVQVHDVVDDELHQSMLSAYQQDPTRSYIAGYEMDAYFPGGYLVVADDNRLTGIIEKPGAENRPSNLVNIVAHMHANAGRVLDAIRAEYEKPQTTDDHYERAIDALLKTQDFRVVPYSGHWSALKYPWHVLDVMNYFLSQIKGQQVAESAYIAPTAALVGDVFIGAGAKVFPGAAVVGPAYLGAGVIVGNNALVRQSMVLDGANVGFTTEVARSYVAAGCQMHACRVLDSVFAENVNFSAGCTTANLRIDHGHVPSVVKGQRVNSGRDKLGAIIGRDAFLGVDVMTMPGVKVGRSAEVGPGVHVQDDIPDNMRVYVKQTLVMKEKKGGVKK